MGTPEIARPKPVALPVTSRVRVHYKKYKKYKKKENCERGRSGVGGSHQQDSRRRLAARK